MAIEIGLEGWEHLLRVLQDPAVTDFGALLYAPACAAHYNIWSASYEEAAQIRAEHGGYLLVYRQQFLVTDGHFLETLGLDPLDPDWDRIGRDWAKPRAPDARLSLCARAVAARLEQLRPIGAQASGASS